MIRYGKQFATNAMRRTTKRFIESRDAIIWEVLLEDRICKVRVQGSNKNILVRFPQNQKTVPTWLRIGNSVQISFKSGIRGYMYITGQGSTVPTPISGEPMPDPGPQADVMLSGGQIVAADIPSDGVIISSGTYRIGGVIYQLTVTNNPLLYGNVPELFFGNVPELFYGGDLLIYLDPAPVSIDNFRYDAFVIGTDGKLDYLKGVEATVPVKPDIPDNHILVDTYILRIGGGTAIEDKHIGMLWTVPAPVNIDLSIGGEGMVYDLDWDPEQTTYTEVDIVVSVLDQYIHPIVGMYTVTLTTEGGGGEFWSIDTDPDWFEDSVSETSNANSFTFKYRREEVMSDVVCIFSATLPIGRQTFKLIGLINL